MLFMAFIYLDCGNMLSGWFRLQVWFWFFFPIINNDIWNSIHPKFNFSCIRCFSLFVFWCLFKIPSTLQMSCKRKCLFLKALRFTIKKNESVGFFQYSANSFIEGKLWKKGGLRLIFEEPQCRYTIAYNLTP